MECDHCDASFSSDRERIEHVLDEHDDAITSHDRDSLKRELNKLEAQGDDSGDMPYRAIGMAALALLAVVGGGYALSSAGIVNLSLNGNSAASPSGEASLGAPGTTHEHAPFTVRIDGEPIDFSQPQYQVGQTQNRHVHFEGGDGTTIHKHATGVTISYTMETLGMELNQTCLTLDTGEEYCDGENGELTVTAGGEDVDPETHVIQEGQSIRITYESE